MTTTDALAESLWAHRDDWPTFRDLLAEMVAEQRAEGRAEAAREIEREGSNAYDRHMVGHVYEMCARIARGTYFTTPDATTEAVAAATAAPRSEGT